MKKIIIAALALLPMLAQAQTANDAYTISQNDLKGTARYMSMAGAYSALGGDISSVSKNPGGIGVYRSSDINLTLNVDIQSVESSTPVESSKRHQTDFICNNFGYVGAIKLNSDVVSFLNWGISYNRPMSLSRRYCGTISNINSSLSNYIANLTNDYGYTSYDLAFEENGNDVIYDPYIDSNAPWLSIMGFNSYIINPSSIDFNGNESNFKGLMNSQTTGFSEFEVIEEGGIDQFDINFGGNVLDKLYWGLSFGLNSLNYTKYTYYGEALNNATVFSKYSGLTEGDASFGLENWLSTSGFGTNFKVGVIYTPISQVRLGLAFHTPTYWTLTDECFSAINYEMSNYTDDHSYSDNEESNSGYIDEVTYKINTPWKINASVATVLGTKAVLSFEYERVAYDDMKIEYRNRFGAYIEDKMVSNSIKDYYKGMDIFRVGAEYRLTPSVSLRAGYSYENSPMNESALNNNMEIITSGTMPAYTFDKSTQYFTGGLGFRVGGFYADLAYVHKLRQSEYHAFSSYADADLNKWVDAPMSSIKDRNSQVVMSFGYRF